MEYSIESMMNIVENLNIEDSGKYMAWDGKVIPYWAGNINKIIVENSNIEDSGKYMAWDGKVIPY